MNELNYAKVYSQQLAQAFPYALNFGALYATENNGRYRFKGGKTIEIPVIKTTGRSASDRDSVDALARNSGLGHINSALNSAGYGHTDDIRRCEKFLCATHGIVVHYSRGLKSVLPSHIKCFGGGVRREGICGVNVVVYVYCVRGRRKLAAVGLFFYFFKLFKCHFITLSIS